MPDQGAVSVSLGKSNASQFALSINRPPEGSFAIGQHCKVCREKRGSEVRDAILHRAIRIAAETHLTKITEQPSDHLAEVEYRIRIMIPRAKCRIGE